MFSNPKQIFIFPLKKVRSVTGFVEKVILITLSLTLSLLFLINGGVDPGNHAFIIPLFGVLIFLHGLYVYLRDKSKRRKEDYRLSEIPFKFLPFLIWALVSVNLISPVPWLGQIYLIYFFEAFIVLWILANHLKNLNQLGIIFVGLSIPLMAYIYLGLDQFFHGKSLTELGVKKIVSGLFFESNSYTFLNSIVIAGIAPAIFFRYWGKVKRFVLVPLALLLFFGVIMANNFQGFLMYSIACICCSYFAFYKKATRIKFLLTVLVVTCMTYLAVYYSITSFNDYFNSAFSFGEISFFFKAWIASFFLFLKNFLLGVGLGGFEAKLPSVKSFSFPLVISNPSNFYLLLLSELGILGLILLAKPILHILKAKYKYLKSIPRMKITNSRPRVPLERFLFSIIISTLVTFLLISFFHSVFIIPFFVCFFMVLIAISDLRIDSDAPKSAIKKNSVFKDFIIPKNSKSARYYFVFFCFFAVLFPYDGFKVLKSHDVYKNAFFDFQTILETSDNFKDEDLLNVLNLVEDSIKENRYNLDAWLLKNQVLNALYNKNSIRYEHYPEQIYDASKFVLDRKKNYWKAWMRHGISLTLNSNFEDAEKSFNRSIKLAPNNFETNFYMGSFLMHFQDRSTEAKEYIEKALVIAPSNQEALALYQKLQL